MRLKLPSAEACGPIVLCIEKMHDVGDLDVASAEFARRAEQILVTAEEKARQRRAATDEAIRAALWSEYSELCREYFVMRAWHYVTYAATIFLEHGYTSAYLPDAQEARVVPA